MQRMDFSDQNPPTRPRLRLPLPREREQPLPQPAEAAPVAVPDLGPLQGGALEDAPGAAQELGVVNAANPEVAQKEADDGQYQLFGLMEDADDDH